MLLYYIIDSSSNFMSLMVISYLNFGELKNVLGQFVCVVDDSGFSLSWLFFVIDKGNNCVFRLDWDTLLFGIDVDMRQLAIQKVY